MNIITLFAVLGHFGLAAPPLHVSSTAPVPSSVDADGSLAAPFASVEAALHYRREILSQKPLKYAPPHRITLSSGAHLPFKLVPELDNGVQIAGAESGPPSVVTGGVEVPPKLFTANRDINRARNGTAGSWTVKIVSAMGCQSYGCPVVSVQGTSSDKFRVTVRSSRCLRA